MEKSSRENRSLFQVIADRKFPVFSRSLSGRVRFLPARTPRTSGADKVPESAASQSRLPRMRERARTKGASLWMETRRPAAFPERARVSRSRTAVRRKDSPAGPAGRIQRGSSRNPARSQNASSASRDGPERDRKDRETFPFRCVRVPVRSSFGPSAQEKSFRTSRPEVLGSAGVPVPRTRTSSSPVILSRGGSLGYRRANSPATGSRLARQDHFSSFSEARPSPEISPVPQLPEKELNVKIPEESSSEPFAEKGRARNDPSVTAKEARPRGSDRGESSAPERTIRAPATDTFKPSVRIFSSENRISPSADTGTSAGPAGRDAPARRKRTEPEKCRRDGFPESAAGQRPDRPASRSTRPESPRGFPGEGIRSRTLCGRMFLPAIFPEKNPARSNDPDTSRDSSSGDSAETSKAAPAPPRSRVPRTRWNSSPSKILPPSRTKIRPS